jgi:hypothetical protein
MTTGLRRMDAGVKKEGGGPGFGCQKNSRLMRRYNGAWGGGGGGGLKKKGGGPEEARGPLQLSHGSQGCGRS